MRVKSHKMETRSLHRFPALTKSQPSSPMMCSFERLLVFRLTHTHDEHGAAINSSPRGTNRNTARIVSAKPTVEVISIWSPYTTSIAAPHKPPFRAQVVIRATPANRSMKSQFLMTISGPLEGVINARMSFGMMPVTCAGTYQASSGRKLIVGSTSHCACAALRYLMDEMIN